MQCAGPSCSPCCPTKNELTGDSMAFISGIGERLAFTVGKQLDVISLQGKRWIVLAGIVGGWAVGFFFAARAIITPTEAIALMATCSYAFARLAADTTFLISWLADLALAAWG